MLKNKAKLRKKEPPQSTSGATPIMAQINKQNSSL